MGNLDRRIGRLEERLRVKSGPPHILVTNVKFEGGCSLELVPGVYVDVIGRPLTTEEISELRAEWERKHRVYEQS